MTYSWRVLLQGENEPRSVTTKKDIPLHAVAAAMDQAGVASGKSVMANTIELIGDDGEVQRTWTR